MSAIYSLSCASGDAATLQLEFRLVGDRFEQSISRCNRIGDCLASWVAVQADQPEPWPASPPIQELHLQSIDGRDVLLGVGRAGKCHWSLSIEAGEVDSAAAMCFDIACRCPQPPQWLGSTYRQETGQSDDAGLSIRCEDDARLISEDQETLRVEPVAMPTTWPGTVRWRYAILATDTNG